MGVGEAWRSPLWPGNQRNTSRCRTGHPSGWTHPPEWGALNGEAMKEVSAAELLARAVARFAAISGGLALLIWVLWVMLDVKNMQSGFTLP